MNKKGFSVIELIISMAVIAIVSAVVFANFRAQDRKIFLEETASGMVRDIEDVRAMSIATREPEIDTENDIKGREYAIRVEEEGYELFVVTEFEEEEEETRIRSISLERGIIIANYEDVPVIRFIPPDPEVRFGDNDEISSATIRMRYEYEEKEFQISVNKMGLVELEHEGW